MQTIFEFIRDHSPAFALFLIVGAAVIWREWEFRIRPIFIPKKEINALVDNLIAAFGSEAEDVARACEEGAWHRSNRYDQGRWRKVRRELWRRYRAGKWQ